MLEPNRDVPLLEPAYGLVDDLDVERCSKRPRVREHITPGHPDTAERLGADEAGEVAVAQLDPATACGREVGRTQRAALEDDVLERGAEQLELSRRQSEKRARVSVA